MNDEKNGNGVTTRGDHPLPRIPNEMAETDQPGWIGQGTVPAASYPSLARPGPPLPQRPAIPPKQSSDFMSQRPPKPSHGDITVTTPSYSPPSLPVPPKQNSRSPSPEKRSRMRTTLRPSKEGKGFSKSRDAIGRRGGVPVASKAAGLAWDSISRASGQSLGQSHANHAGSTTTIGSIDRDLLGSGSGARRESTGSTKASSSNPRSRSYVRQSSPPDSTARTDVPRPSSYHDRPSETTIDTSLPASRQNLDHTNDRIFPEPSRPSISKSEMAATSTASNTNRTLPYSPKTLSDFPSYRSEYPAPSPASKASALADFNHPLRKTEASAPPLSSRQRSPPRKSRPPIPPPPPISRRPIANVSSPRMNRQDKDVFAPPASSESADEQTSSSREVGRAPKRPPRKKKSDLVPAGVPTTPPSSDRDSPEGSINSNVWEERVAYVKKHLPKGVDENAAKQIFNEIVVHGDEVHWDDVAGLDVAKKALKEAVVYPFLRPDLFMGLREPARGMLLFGPPGTGKTMLARAVATESRSTFFAISASSLTSKWLGESEKLVRALFALARALAPSIIFVDEIDSLLSSRGGSSEHESTRRIKTEFLIQWSDLQRAAAGKEQTEKEKKEGDASRVLVLAATNLPWAIDEAARRRFVRRQYIPLPEGHVRATQLRTLLGHQKHELNEQDIAVLVELTEGEGVHCVSLKFASFC